MPGFVDLGSGVVFGSRAFSAADVLTTVSIALTPSALAAMNSGRGLFALGGAVTTLDGTFGTAAGFPAETVLLSNCANGCISRLVLDTTPVPEPGSLLLLGSGLALGARRLLAQRRGMR